MTTDDKIEEIRKNVSEMTTEMEHQSGLLKKFDKAIFGNNRKGLVENVASNTAWRKALIWVMGIFVVLAGVLVAIFR